MLQGFSLLVHIYFEASKYTVRTYVSTSNGFRTGCVVVADIEFLLCCCCCYLFFVGWGALLLLLILIRLEVDDARGSFTLGSIDRCPSLPVRLTISLASSKLYYSSLL